jgi:hypothetical protein
VISYACACGRSFGFLSLQRICELSCTSSSAGGVVQRGSDGEPVGRPPIHRLRLTL